MRKKSLIVAVYKSLMVLLVIIGITVGFLVFMLGRDFDSLEWGWLPFILLVGILFALFRIRGKIKKLRIENYFVKEYRGPRYIKIDTKTFEKWDRQNKIRPAIEPYLEYEDGTLYRPNSCVTDFEELIRELKINSAEIQIFKIGKH